MRSGKSREVRAMSGRNFARRSVRVICTTEGRAEKFLEPLPNQQDNMFGDILIAQLHKGKKKNSCL